MLHTEHPEICVTKRDFMPDSGDELRQCGDKMRQHLMSEMSRSKGPAFDQKGHVQPGSFFCCQDPLLDRSLPLLQQSQRKPGELPLIGTLGIFCKRAFSML
jgi:hypothetical protein